MGCAVSSIDQEGLGPTRTAAPGNLHSVSPTSPQGGPSSTFLRKMRYEDPEQWRRKRENDVDEEFRMWQYQSRGRHAQRGAGEHLRPSPRKAICCSPSSRP